MAAGIAEVASKLREIEQQALAAFIELPKYSIAYARLRHIVILAKHARLKLDAIEPGSSIPSKHDATTPAKPSANE